MIDMIDFVLLGQTKKQNRNHFFFLDSYSSQLLEKKIRIWFKDVLLSAHYVSIDYFNSGKNYSSIIIFSIIL